MDFWRDLYKRIGLVLTALCVCLTVYVLFFWPEDITAEQNEDRHVFGATYMTMNNPYYSMLDSRLRAVIEEHGDVLLTRDAAMNQDRQNQEVKDLIDAGAEVIFITPVEWDTVDEALQTAARANVPVIVVDAPVKDDRLVTCTVVSDNYQAGVLCAQHLLKHRTSASVILLEHTSARSGTQRIQGFVETLAGHEGFELVAIGESDGQIENAMPVMVRLLDDHPEADTVMALNDPSAFGALAAIEGSGRMESFQVYSVDGSPEAKGLIHDGLMTATCAQFPYEAVQRAAEIAYRVLAGEQVEKEVIVPVKLITAENVSEFDLTGWQ
ncbi:MAG: sugar ABC transporter substrate-binding protein [Solobacterium sp.]|nr:sugar ABC transporter substrate-binding protein [Solobacterium sp.]